MGILNLILGLSLCAAAESGRPPKLSRRYRSLVVFGDSYSDSQSPHSVFKPWQSDEAWPEHLRPLLGARRLLNLAISGATSGRRSTVLGHRGGVQDQLDSFREDLNNGSLFRDYPRSSLVAWEVAGINDIFLSIPPKEIFDNFKTTLYDIAQFRKNTDVIDLLILPLTMGQNMPLYKYHSTQFKSNLSEKYKTVSRSIVKYVKQRCQGLRRKGLRIWMMDAVKLDRDMHRFFKNTEHPLVSNQWRVNIGDYAREDFMWWDSIHWTDQSNKFVADEMIEVLKKNPLCR